MSFRARVFGAIALAALLPLIVFALGVRRESERRLGAEYGRRTDALVTVLRGDIAREGAAVSDRLRALAGALAADNRLRAALRGDPAARRYQLDYAGAAMRAAGLALLQIQDDSGRILSSGHFRNEYDRVVPEALRLATAGETTWLVRARTAAGPMLALARADSARVADALLALVGGTAVDSAWLGRLTRDPELAVALVLPGGAAPAGDVVATVTLPFADFVADGRGGITADSARLVVTRSAATLLALRRGVDAWFLVAALITAAGALLIAAWVSARVSRPVRELAEKTAAIDLDRLDQDFATDRTDEIGALTRLLGAMTARLRASASRLREAERRAAVGDLARQVNHDVKNGLAPIRHVVRHLVEVSRDDPGALTRVLDERKGTLESSIAYLDDLARNYARLSPELARGRCDANAVVRELVRDAGRAADLRTDLAEPLPLVRADGVALRRILENLVGNAVDSLDGRRGGTVTLATRLVRDGDAPRVRITVADTGRGMTRAELERAFDDFYTTKPDGIGLGLSVVRRLTADLEGSLRVETEPGAGTRMLVELPAVEAA